MFVFVERQVIVEMGVQDMVVIKDADTEYCYTIKVKKKSWGRVLVLYLPYKQPLKSCGQQTDNAGNGKTMYVTDHSILFGDDLVQNTSILTIR